MAPAFSSGRQATAFALLLAVLLALPALVAGTGWLDRRDVYSAIPWKFAPSPWLQQQIFVEKKAVDMAFAGSSHIWCAVDAPYVRQQLSERLGREAEVFTLGWPWPGFDALYIIARDLLERRRVQMLVVCDEDRGADAPHLHSARWFRMGEDSQELVGLPLRGQVSLYGGAVLGMPRHLLSLARPNLLEDPAVCRPNFWNTYYHAPNLAEQYGTLRARLAYGVSPDFVSCQPRGDAKPTDARVYSSDTRASFEFTGRATQPYQLHFAQKLARLCQQQGTRLVVLHTPRLRELGQTAISERRLWSEEWGTPVDLVGIAPARLFAGIAADDVPKLFYEDGHLNQNGQEMFTPLITPALLRLYDCCNCR
jgi:hypothetical protein